MKEAAAPLFEKTGPAVVVTHSQSGPFGWIMADTCPGVVKGMVQLEPKGPLFHDDSKRISENAVWGLTEIPLHYVPEVQAPSELKREPVRQLPNLSDVPIMIMTGTASKHARNDHLTADYLRPAGVKHVKHMKLADTGLYGNEHMIMIEKNNLEAAALALNWIEKTINSNFPH